MYRYVDFSIMPYDMENVVRGKGNEVCLIPQITLLTGSARSKMQTTNPENLIKGDSA